MTRTSLPDRRFNITTSIAWTSPAGPDHKLIVTYGFGPSGNVREAFCAGFRAHSDICALANDACILLSRLLQYGEKLEKVAESLGENRHEGEKIGAPASVIGAIARKGIEVQHDLKTHGMPRDKGVIERIIVHDGKGHDLYKTGDPDAPDIIKGRNGDVVLALCRRCGRGEIQLEDPCDVRTE